VAFHDSLADRQTKTCSLVLSAIMEPFEWLEYLVGVGRLEPDAIVLLRPLERLVSGHT
jgi:hypothetical protein